MKKHVLLAAGLSAFFSISDLHADVILPTGMEALTPANVEVTVGTVRSYDKAKAMTVAGSKGSGYQIFFTAKDAAHGEELWVSDGTVSGTKMVKDIYPGATSSNVSYLTRFNDKVVFQAIADEDGGAELWISDGTEGGTHLLMDINILGGSEPRGFVQINETHFIFSAKDFESETYADEAQRWLWISDGTAEGTRMLKDCNVKYPGTSSANDETHFMRVGRKVFFKADSKDNEHGEELWVTDGTENGTFMLLDINKKIINEATAATAGAQLDWFTNFKNKKLFFSAYSNEYGNEPWVSDGTPEGTYMIADLTEGNEENGNPRGHGVFSPRVYNNEVYFRGNHPNYGLELFKTDFTKAGTVIVADLNQNPIASGTANGSPDLFCEFDGVLFMKAATGSDPAATSPINYGLELFYSDGTASGTKMQSDLNPGIGPNAAWEGIVVSGSFFFRAQDQTPPAGSSQFWELFSMDSKDEFPHKVVDLGEGPDFVHSLRNMNGDLFFTSTIVKSLFKYKYRKPNFDPSKDVEEMDIVFDEEGESSIDNEVVNDNINISFYPNPTKDIVNLVSESEIKGYKIFDMTGRNVASHKGNEDVISVSNLSKGVYVLVVENDFASKRFTLIID